MSLARLHCFTAPEPEFLPSTLPPRPGVGLGGRGGGAGTWSRLPGDCTLSQWGAAAAGVGTVCETHHHHHPTPSPTDPALSPPLFHL